MWIEDEYKESKDNPLHKEFGIWSNTRYILGKILKYRPEVVALLLLGMVCSSVLSYFWGIFGKYVIDIIQAGLTEEEAVGRLIRIVLLAGVIACL